MFRTHHASGGWHLSEVIRGARGRLPSIRAGVIWSRDPSIRWDDGLGPALLLEDVGGALVAGEKIGALGRLDERLQRLHPGEQPDEIVLSAEGENRIDQIVPDTRLALLDLQAIGQEIGHGRERRSSGGSVGVKRVIRHVGADAKIGDGAKRSVDRFPKADPQAVPRDQLKQAQGGAPKGERILRARGRHVGEEEVDQGVELVGNADRNRHRRGRDVIALPDRLVMVADRVGDFVGLALGAGKVAADDALELGELADQAGDQIGLGEARGAFGEIGQGRHPGGGRDLGGVMLGRMGRAPWSGGGDFLS